MNFASCDCLRTRPLAGVRAAGAVLALAMAGCLITSPASAQSVGSARAPERPAAAAAASQPAAWRTRLDYAAAAVSVQVALPEAAQDQAFMAAQAQAPGIPLQIGFPRELPEWQGGSLVERAVWTRLPGGGQVTSFSVRSPGAAQLRAALQAELPPGAKLRFFGGDGGEAYPLYTMQDLRDRGAGRLTGDARDGALWSPIMDGEAVGIEVEIPEAALPSEVVVGVVLLSHIPPKQALLQSQPANADEECALPLLDVACSADLPEISRAATALFFLTNDVGVTGTCSGTALDTHRTDSENSARPYFLTAQHCVGTQRAADSIEVAWHYETTACNGSVIDSNQTTLRGGANLLAADPGSDVSLLELRDPLPNGAALSRWSVDAAGRQAIGTSVHSVHHPSGQTKKYSVGVAERFGLIVDNSGQLRDALQVEWSEGSTRGGSSGSGLFAMDGQVSYLIGVLSGGPECSETDYYGRFDMFFNNHAQQHLGQGEALEDDYGGSPSAATGILLGSTVSGSIDHGADRDLFRIEVTEPGSLTLHTTGSTVTVGRLYGNGDDLVGYGVDDSGGNFSLMAFVTEGTYYVAVSGYDPDATGDYELHVEFTAEREAPTAEVPLFPPADPARHGFLRVFNASRRAGSVQITAFDDNGARHGPVSLALNGRQTRHLNAMDLEGGNAEKGLTGSLGSGAGDWRLRFDTDLTLDVGAFVRTADGFVTAMHDVAHLHRGSGERGSGHHVVAFFNPGSNNRQQSKLRLVNPDGESEVNVVVSAEDDAGWTGTSEIELTLPPGASRTYTAAQLEEGHEDFDGQLGDGSGKWRLWVKAESRIMVMSLLETPTGHLTNLSTPGHITR